jgi:hypothetical protein
MIDLTGREFERLKVDSRAANRGARLYWNCTCKCGNRVVVAGSALKDRSTKSCGCFRQDRMGALNYKHGQHKTRTYKIWSTMIERCSNSNNAGYARYGGRGITVCDRWRHSFGNFLADMGECPKGLTIERKDNNGNYEPDNCKWATAEEQANNRSNNRVVTYRGTTRTISEWAREVHLDRTCLSSRLDDGWPIEKALTTPSRRSANKMQSAAAL